MMLAGHAAASFELADPPRPAAAPDAGCCGSARSRRPIRAARDCVQLGLEGTDERVRADKSVTPTFLFAVLLWPAILRALARRTGRLPEDPQHLLAPATT